MKKLINFAFIFIFLFLIGCTSKTEEPKVKYKFSITELTVEIEVGEKYTIDTSNETLELFFESNNSSICSVNSNGVITGKKDGTATIIVSLYDDDNQYIEINVTVKAKQEIIETPTEPIPEKVIDSLKIVGANSVYQEETITLAAEYDKSINVDLEWSISDETVASFNNNVLKGLKEGTVTVTLTDKISKLVATKLITVIAKLDDNGIANLVLEWAIETLGDHGASEVILPAKHNKYPTAKISWDSDDHILFDPEEGLLDLVNYDTKCNVTCTVEYNGITVSRTYEYTVESYPLYEMAKKFISQFKAGGVYNDINLATSFNNYGGTTVTWRSSNPSILTNGGIYTRPFNDEYIDIIYTVTLTNPNISKEFTTQIRAEGMNIDQKAEYIIEYLQNNVGENGSISSSTEFPSYIEEYNAKVEWQTTTGTPLDTELFVGNPILAETAITLIAKITIDGETTSTPIQFVVISNEYQTKWDLIDLFIETIASQTVNQYNYVLITWVGRSNGYVPFVTNDRIEVYQDILPYTYGNQRTGAKMTSVEYICVHDTGNTSAGANAEMHRRYITNLNNDPSSTSVSWHFCIDDKQCIQHLPLDEKAWHAGDGSGVALQFIDTGIKYTGIVNFTITDDGYFALNGTKTSIAIPKDSSGNPALNAHVPALGFNWRIGSNGNVWMGNTYLNTGFNCISNRGGNNNSIGIESAVYEGTDYTHTIRRLAKLVAGLCVDFNLSTDRIKQHNTFSGKDCPMVIRQNNRWEELIFLAKLEYFAMTQLKDVKFEWHSLSPDVMDDEGRILTKLSTGSTVDYSCKVTYNGETKTYVKTAEVVSK